MRIFCCLLAIVLMGFAAPAVADFYKYVDQNGVTRYTDNLADIPEDQRPKIETFEGSENDSAYGESAQESGRKSDKLQEERQAVKAKRKQQDLTRSGTKGEQMRQTRDALESEHAALMKEKDALEAKRDTLKTAKEVRAYQNEVARLNRKIAAFEKRRQAFKNEVDAFNEGQGR